MAQYMNKNSRVKEHVIIEHDKLINLIAGQEYRLGHREQFGHSRGRKGWDNSRK